MIGLNLDVDVKKIGRVFGPRWSSFSHRACLAVLNNYEALHAHLTETDDAESAALALLLESTFFFKSLGVVTDVLHEIKLLSEALQNRNTTVVDADYL